MSTQRGAEWRQSNVETAPFFTNKEVHHLITETEVSIFEEVCLSVCLSVWVTVHFRK